MMALLVLLLVSSAASAASGYLSITVNDVLTHYSVPALVKIQGKALVSANTDDAGRVKRELPPGDYRLQISAAGYESMTSRAAIESGKTNFLGFMLRPLSPPEEERLEISRIRAGFTLVHGYATDADQGKPAAGVKVRLEKAGAETVTDQRGYYWLSVVTPPETAPDLPGTDTLIAEKPGFKTVIHRNILIGGEDSGGYFLGMERGIGIEEHDDTHKQMRKNVERQAVPPHPPPKRD